MKTVAFTLFFAAFSVFTSAQKSWTFGATASSGSINFRQSLDFENQKFEGFWSRRVGLFSAFRISKNIEAVTGLRLHETRLKHRMMFPFQALSTGGFFECWGPPTFENQFSTLRFWEAPIGGRWALNSKKWSPVVSGSAIFGGLVGAETWEEFSGENSFQSTGVSTAQLSVGGEFGLGVRRVFLDRIEFSATGFYRKMMSKYLDLTSEEISFEAAVGYRF